MEHVHGVSEAGQQEGSLPGELFYRLPLHEGVVRGFVNVAPHCQIWCNSTFHGGQTLKCQRCAFYQDI